MKSNNDFEFKYSAPTNLERKEIESIRSNYIKDSASEKLQILRKLDNKVKNIPMIFSLIFGVVGILIFGLGLTMILEWNNLVWGIVISIISLAPIALAYPVYIKLQNKLKAKYGDEIIKLSDELLNN